MRQEPWFCLFQGDAGPMAVSAESVAEVIRTDSLVRLAWSPPQVVGLCPYHREVVPVVRFAPLPPDLGGDRSIEANPASGEKPDGDDHSRCILLILRTEHGAWGIRCDFVWTVMSRVGPESQQGRTAGSIPVLAGTLSHAGTRYGVLDVEATWHGLRSAISRWYGLIGEA